TLARLESAPPAGEWSLAQQPWTPAMVGQVAGMLGERARAEKILESWDEGRSLVWTARGSPGRPVALSVVRHQSPAGARAYYGFALGLQRRQDELSGPLCGGSLKVLESRSGPVTLAGVEEAVRHDKRLQFGAGAAPLPVTVLLAR